MATFIKYITVICLVFFCFSSYSQLRIDNEMLSAGTRNYSYDGDIIAPAYNSTVSYSGNAKINYVASNSITLKPGFNAGGFTNGGYFSAKIDKTLTKPEPITIQNDFKIGILAEFDFTHKYVPSCGQFGVPYETPLDEDGYKTSTFNVLAEDGFNIVEVGMFEWSSEEWIKSELKLASANGLKAYMYGYNYFKPDVVNNVYTGTGHNDFTNCGVMLDPCKSPYEGVGTDQYFNSNYENMLNDVFTVSPFKDIIWCHQVAGESSFKHCINFDANCIGWEYCNSLHFIDVEVPPLNVSQAFIYFKEKLAEKSVYNHKLVLGEANHHSSINDNTDDQEWDPVNDVPFENEPFDYDQPDYIHLLDKYDNREVSFEYSYTQFPEDDWINETYDRIDGDGRQGHYLGPFASIDYEYNFTNEVHKVITVENTSVPKGENYFHHYNSIENTPNANWLWFQAYNSIVHNAKGIWFWGLKLAWENGETDHWTDNTAQPDRYDFNFFPDAYKNFISPLSRELRYLVNTNLLSTDPASIIATKKDAADEFCIVPAIETYLPTFMQFPFPEKRTENYGLRYTIRTNGTDAIIIITNPLNIAITATLNFNGIANPIIRNSTGVDVLFEASAADVTSNTYKTSRDADIDLINNTVGISYPVNFPSQTDKSVTLDFGPMDVHVLKFNTDPDFVVDGYNNNWEKVWSNNGSNVLDGWGLNNNDKLISGDFDGDGAEEILFIQSSVNNAWASFLNYENSNWQWGWSNNGDGTIDGWGILADDKFIAGDFNNDGKDELLCIQSSDLGAFAVMASFDDGDWHWYWGNNGNGTIDGWGILADDKFIAGDFNKDGADELFCVQSTDENTWAYMVNYHDGDFYYLWSNNDNPPGLSHIDNWNISASDEFKAGDFDADGRSDLLCIQRDGSDAEVLYFIPDNTADHNWTSGYSNYGGSLAGWSMPLNAYDKALVGDVDGDLNDELMCVQRCTYCGWATTFDFDENNDFQWRWSNSGDPSFIDDWNVKGSYLIDNKINTDYFFIKAVVEEPPYLMAFRTFDCGYLSSMYKSMNIYGDYLKLDSTSVVTNDTIRENNSTLVAYSFDLYPNPNDGNMKIYYEFPESETGIFEVYSLMGEKLFSYNLYSGKNSFSIFRSDLNQGIYFYRATAGNEIIAADKIVVIK